MTLPPDARMVLADRTSPIGALTRAVAAIEATLDDAAEIAIGLSGSVTIDLLGLFLRREAALAGVRARIVPGNFDDPIGDVERFRGEGVEHVVMLPFFDTILPAFEAQLPCVSPELLEAKEAELRGRYRLALQGCDAFKSVHLGLYHRIGTCPDPSGADAVSATIQRFNAMLAEESASRANVQLIDMSAIMAEIGTAAAFDLRFYFQAKAPYTATFLGALARRVAAQTRGFGTYFYKMLALDCDNTLWGGVLGEDLVEGVHLDPYDYPGNIFWRVQQMIAALEAQGLLICLCTKNNPADVEEVFRRHPHMVLKDAQIVARRVNWQNKVANLEELAAELNIGLESVIFLDDNPVEIEGVRARLPQVMAVQVPKALRGYPAVVESVAALYLAGGVSVESRGKTEQYRQRAAASEARSAFANHDDYLASLELRAELHVDRVSEVPRISELSMKSNQFNLTTRRYAEAEIAAMMASADAEVASVTISNKFGDAGLTGIVVLRFTDQVAIVENFLMSCRVLGQSVELAIWERIVERCRARGCAELRGTYLPSAKNAQVRNFYDRLGLALVEDGEEARCYAQPLHNFSPPHIPWIEVQDA